MVAPRLVGHATDIHQLHVGLAQPARQLGRLDEFLVVVGALGQQPCHVLGANDGHCEGRRGAVDGRQEQMATRLQQALAGLDDRARAASSSTGTLRYSTFTPDYSQCRRAT
ncbi:hypothetical protein G6F46_015290 [Rhizopus delemar]|nr:hypothetical protein G6F46_015290 [Rhizopus delemar]